MELGTFSELLGGSEDLLQLLVEHLPAGVALADRNGAVRAHNAEWTRLMGAPPTSLRDYRFRAVDTAPAGGEARSPIDRALEGTEVHDEEVECARLDGPVAHVRLSAIPLGESDRGGVLILVVDVAERRSLDAIRQQVLGVVAHDLRNPLSALRMTASMLARPKEMPTERRVQLAERMLGTLGRMEGIVSSLLDFARAEAGVALRLTREPVDLVEVLDRVKKELEVVFPNRQIEPRVVGAVNGQWDRSRIERVVANLLTNALRHGADDGVVTVTMDGSSEDIVALSVHNTGTPISAELLPQVFEPFTIAPVPEGGRRRNIGLGLFIVRHLVTAHGGSVSVRSDAEAGTTFTITLPRRPA